MTILRDSTRIAVLREADVIVAGGGIAGIFAALAASREGADTVLIDRFGTVGGHCGPGLGTRHDLWQHPAQHRRGLGGVVGEFLDELERDGGLTGFSYGGEFEDDWGWPSMPKLPVIERTVYTKLALRKLLDAKVRLLLDTAIVDAVRESGAVRGVVVNGQSGTHAVLGRTVIDCTGNSVVAAKCGCAVTPGPEFNSSGFGLLFQVSGVDWETYRGFRMKAIGRRQPEAESQWFRDVFFRELGTDKLSWSRDMAPYIKQAWDDGSYRYVQRLDGLATMYFVPFGVHDQDIGAVQYGPAAGVDLNNPFHMSTLHARSRVYAHDTIDFYRRFAPGFAAAHVAQIAPLFGSRYGRVLDSVYAYREEDIWGGTRFDDVVHALTHLYKNWGSDERRRTLIDLEHGEEGVVYEIPYRLLVARGVDGLLAAGRNVNGNSQSRLRARWIVMLTGAIAGTAAAMAVESGVVPRQLDVTALQRRLLDCGYYLGDTERLRELEIAD